MAAETALALPQEPSNASYEQSQAMLPFHPPEAVQKWLRKEDWEALTRAWAEAEQHAFEWAESDLAGLGEDFWEDDYDSQMQQAQSWQQDEGHGTGEKRRSQSTKNRPGWNQDFNLLGSDSRKPPPLRRYFDRIPAETLPPTEAIRPGLRPRKTDERGKEHDRFAAMMGIGWRSWHHQDASVDNTGLHPHLRHYFDRRGLEASYRQRPHIDHPSLQTMKPRTPGRVIMERMKSEPTLKSPSIGQLAPEPPKAIHWGTRCLRYGPDHKVMQGPDGDKIPWVYDHHRCESEDNDAINPLNRHYFDVDGLESSFRNRGRQYGRPLKSVFGMQFSVPPNPSSPASGSVSSLKASPSRSTMSKH